MMAIQKTIITVALSLALSRCHSADGLKIKAALSSSSTIMQTAECDLSILTEDDQAAALKNYKLYLKYSNFYDSRDEVDDLREAQSEICKIKRARYQDLIDKMTDHTFGIVFKQRTALNEVPTLPDVEKVSLEGLKYISSLLSRLKYHTLNDELKSNLNELHDHASYYFWHRQEEDQAAGADGQEQDPHPVASQRKVPLSHGAHRELAASEVPISIMPVAARHHVTPSISGNFEGQPINLRANDTPSSSVRSRSTGTSANKHTSPIQSSSTSPIADPELSATLMCGVLGTCVVGGLWLFIHFKHNN